ncbi:MAG: DUF4352 domain-containing protein [Parcubacteria group bacterium]|nr:DUF4352 domain-containing protein [Parcubacteria group bacterium]
MPSQKENTASKSTQPAASPQTPAASTPSQPQPPKKKSKGLKIALSIAAGCLVAVLIIAILGYYVYLQVKKRAEEKIEDISFEELEKNFANLPSTEELDKIAEDIDKSTSESTEKSGSIGEKLSDGEVIVTVNSFKKQDKIKSNTAVDNYEYVLIHVTLENETQQDISVFTSNFSLRDSDSHQYYEASLADELEDQVAAWQTISAGEKESGNIVFEVRKEAKDLKILYDGEVTLEFVPGS